jgi:uncharacterized protein (DUF1330 family)
VAEACWIATYRSIKNPEALAAYAKLAGPAIWSAGGRHLVRGTPAKTLEDGLDLRTVVIEFESFTGALAAYESPAYQAARNYQATGTSEIFASSKALSNGGGVANSIAMHAHRRNVGRQRCLLHYGDLGGSRARSHVADQFSRDVSLLAGRIAIHSA